MPAFQDAFISYGRADSRAFVIALKEQLQARGLGQIWLDLDDIPAATDWQQRIDEAIGRSHNFIYVISPSAMASPYCKLELTLACHYGKRIIPLLHVARGDSKVWAIADPEGCATVRQLNWIWCRDRLDDAEQYLETLSRTLRYGDEQTGQAQAHVQAYVHQHTTLLAQALSWQQHHRQTRYLLVGSDRQAAETWLQTPFVEGKSAPCTPTDLHCEYITESIKNANNLMTQVFLCHSDADQAAAEQIRRSLLRRGMTVWNYRTDIQTSQDYNSAITGGIEEADNILFLLSPQSAQSPYCQRELQQALDLHKRVIPVLAAPTDPELVPESLRTLQYVDLTDNTQASDYQADESQLLKLLGTDAAYHTEHKTWLVQALKWQRQQQNPTLLLRGYNLRQAETWLKVARTHPHPPTELHTQFIAESLRQPPDSSLDVFISYSRVDSDFARRLNDALQTQGKRTWFDQESIATGSDFQQEIYRGIESSDVFVFVLSPEAVNSPFCADEVEYAQGLNKRMVTVLHRAIDVADLHPVLAKLQWLDFRDHDGDFQANFAGLLRTLDTDREHLETHTRLLVRSGEWDRRGRDESLLLRGQDLQTAETWLTSNAAVEPLPTGLQQEYIRAGRARQEAEAAAERKLRRGMRLGALAAAAGILVAAGSGLFAWNQQQKATASIKEADERIAQADTRVNEADRKVETASKQAEAATQQTRQAKRDQQQAVAAAEDAAVAQQTAETRASEADGKAQTAAVAQQQAEASAQAAAAKAQAAEGRARNADSKATEAEKAQYLAQAGARLEQQAVMARQQFESQQTEALLNATRAVYELKALVDKYQITRISDYPAGSPILAMQTILDKIQEFRLEGHRGYVGNTQFSSDSRYVAAQDEQDAVFVWDKYGKLVRRTPIGRKFDLLSFVNPNQAIMADEEGVYIWSIENNDIRQIIEKQLSTSWTTSQYGSTYSYIKGLSVEGERMAIINSSNQEGEKDSIELWDLTGKLVPPVETSTPAQFEFSPKGDRILIVNEEGSARLFDINGAALPSELEREKCNTSSLADSNSIYELDYCRIEDIIFSPTGDRFATIAKSGMKLWDSNGNLISSTVREGTPTSNFALSDFVFTPDGERIVTLESSWSKLPVPEGQPRFSPHGEEYIYGEYAYYLRVYDSIDGDQISTFPIGNPSSSDLFVSNDGSKFAVFDRFGTTQIFRLSEGQIQLLQTLNTAGNSTEAGDVIGQVVFIGDEIATVGHDGIFKLWDAGGQLMFSTVGWDLVLSPNQQYLLVNGDRGNAFSVWNFESESEQAPVYTSTNAQNSTFDRRAYITEGRTAPVNDALCSRAREIASEIPRLGHELAIRCPNIDWRNEQELPSGDSEVSPYSRTFSSTLDTDRFLVRDRDTLSCLDLFAQNSDVIRTFRNILGGYQDPGFRCSSDGTRIFSTQGFLGNAFSEHRGTWQTWDSSSLNQETSDRQPHSLASLWNQEGGLLARLETEEHRNVHEVMFVPESNRIFTFAYNLRNERAIGLWDWNGNLVQYISLGLAPDQATSPTQNQDSSLNQCLSEWDAFYDNSSPFSSQDKVPILTSPNHNRIAFIENGTVKLWDWQGNLLGTAFQQSSARNLRQLIFTPTGTILTRDERGAVRLWNQDGYAISPTIQGTADNPAGALISGWQGEQYLFTTSGDCAIKLWTLNGESLPLSIQGPANIAVSPDGNFIATNDINGLVQLWGKGGRLLASSLQSRPGSLSFSPSGRRIVINHERTADIWEFSTGAVARLRGDQPIYSITFNDDEQLITTIESEDDRFSTSESKTTRMWTIRGYQIAEFSGENADDYDFNNRILEQLIARGCNRLRNYLTYSLSVSNEDRAMCNISRRDSAPVAPFESSLGRSLVQVQVTWPTGVEGRG